MHRPVVRRLFSFLILAALAAAACTTIKNFNQGAVHFPKQAVRAVFTRLEQNLSIPDEGPPTSGLKKVPLEREALIQDSPSSLGCPGVPSWWPVGVACAQEQTPPERAITLPHDIEGALLTELRHLIEVREALLSRRQREALIIDWKKKEIIGEAKDGQLVFLFDRKEVDREILARVANENDDRQIIMRGMVKAVLAINVVESDERNISAQIPATTHEFAAVRLRLSPEGTWVQLPDGQWIKK